MKNNLALLHIFKYTASFYSGRWNTGTNPDLALASTSDRCFHDRRVLERFSRSQHRLSLITNPKIMVFVPSEPYKRWNFGKANWKKNSDITYQLAKNLPSPNTNYIDKAYQDFCNFIITAAKRAIPRGRRNKFKLFWDAECEDSYQVFLRAQRGKTSDTTAIALLARLDEKRKGRWSEAVKSFDFTHWTAGWPGLQLTT